MTVGSLFSGIGGLERGLEMCGLGPVVWQAESDPYARAVLAKHWPTVRRYDDVRGIDERAERSDVICGGFPCQDISNAGKRAGIGGARSGLWSEFARIIRDLRPRVVFVENVAALTVRGLDRVLGDLAALGFNAEWDVLRAADVGAPHLRARLFVLAYANGLDERIQPRRIEWKSRPDPALTSNDGSHWPVADTTGVRWGEGRHDVLTWEPDAKGRSVGPVAWSIEPDVGRVAHGVPARSHRLRLLGNAVVPAQAALAWRTLTARVAAQGTT